MLQKTLASTSRLLPYKVRRACNLIGLDSSVKFGTDSVYHQKYDEESLREKRFFNFGAGGFKHHFWSNIEAANSYDDVFAKQVDVEFDFTSRDRLPVDDNCAEICYTSHVVEHLRDRHVEHIFGEACRILKPGGIFRVTCPSVTLACLAVETGDLEFFKALIGTQRLSTDLTVDVGLAFYISRQLVLPEIGRSQWDLPGFMELRKERGRNGALDYLCSLSWDEYQKTNPVHINWWDEEKMVRMLQRAGFSQVYVSAYGQSSALVMRDTNLFDNTHPQISLFVEAQK
jgi:ubiquinone/menaquinone biosynthesis C-methylase UbiE